MTVIIRLILTAVLALGLAAPAWADENAPRLSEEEIEELVRDYLLKNPEVIVEALQVYQQRQEQAEAEQARRMLLAHADRLDDPTGRFVAGNPDGDVTIVEFFDYRCGFCKRVMPTLLDEVQRDGNVRLVFKEFPVLGEESVRAARAGIAAARQGRYYDMHLALMQTRGSLTEERIMAIAGDLGLDTEQMKRDMISPETEAEISRNYELAQALNIRGTPAFVIGEELVPGAIGPERMQALIERARASDG
jgi:protein-disulfide isomerase